MDIDINKYISELVDKSKDYISDLDNNLVSFKQSSDDMQSLNKIQSVISNLKSMSKGINISSFENLHKLASDIETLIDGIFKSKTKVTPDTVNTLSKSIEDLKSCVNGIINTKLDNAQIGQAVIGKLGSIISDKMSSK